MAASFTHPITASDGTVVHYGSAGDGPPLLLTNGLTTTVHFWKYLAPHWRTRRRVITWDMPGHGRSSPARSQQSAQIAGQAELLAAIMDAAGIERATHVGWSTGCQVVLEFYRRYPERCDGLALLLGTPGRVLSTSTLPVPGPTIEWLSVHTPRPLFAAATRLLAQIANAPFGQVLPRLSGLIGKETSHADAAEITRHLRAIDPSTIQVMVASAEQHSAWDLLPSIRVPTYIVAGDRDPFAPATTVGVAMAEAIPAAKLLRLSEGTHTALLDHADDIRDFLEPLLMG